MAKKKKALDYNKLTMGMLSWVARAVVIILVIALFFVGITKSYSFGYHVFNPTARTGTEDRVEAELVIESGDTGWDVGRKLESLKIVDGVLTVWAQSILYEIHFAPGTYLVSSDMTSMDILNKLHSAYEEMKE